MNNLKKASNDITKFISDNYPDSPVNNQPKVTIITPTTASRREFNNRITTLARLQDYSNIIQHLFLYSNDTTIGKKRNQLCGLSSGDIIIHMDSDDLYAPDWISKSVEHLIKSKADITGLSAAYFYDSQNAKLNSWNWYDSVPRPTQPYVNEATMCYWRRVWENNPFPDTSEGEGRQFLTNAGRCIPHDYKEGFTAIVHGGNICSHKSLKLMKALPLSNASELLRNHYPMPQQ